MPWRSRLLVVAVLATGTACRADPGPPPASAPIPGTPGGPVVPTPPAVATVRSPPDDWDRSDTLKASLLPEVPADERDGVASRVVKIEQIPAPYLATAELYRLTRTARPGEPMVHHPWTWLMVRVPGDGLRMLGADADWDRLRSRTKLALDSELARVAYVRTVLEVRGRSASSYAWIADSVADLRLFTSAAATAMPRASDEAEAKRARAIEARLVSVVKPLALPGGAAPWTGELYAVDRARSILRVKVVLAADGTLTLTDTVVEAAAPVPGVFP